MLLILLTKIARLMYYADVFEQFMRGQPILIGDLGYLSFLDGEVLYP